MLLSSHFHIGEGETVLDVGAGRGTFVPHLARKVGPRGRVIACDVDRAHIDALDTLSRSKGYSNVDPRWCDVEVYRSTRVRDAASDHAVLINTLYQLEDRLAAIAEVYRALRTGGVVYVVDWEDSFGGIGPAPDMVVSKASTISLFESALFIYEREYPAGSFHYGLAFRKL